MRHNKFSFFHFLIISLLLIACGTRKHATASGSTENGIVHQQASNQSLDANQQKETSVTAKLRLDLSSGERSLSVGGMLRMKRNDVIQLSLVTFGILEVARIEMTPDYFMLIDKVGRQYVKASYSQVPFLRDADVDFYTIQAYFWDEQTSNLSGWERKDYVNVGGRSLPTSHNITIPTSRRTIKAELTLSNLNTDSEWEKRTEVPSRYKEVTVDEAMSRIMNLTM